MNYFYSYLIECWLCKYIHIAVHRRGKITFNEHRHQQPVLTSGWIMGLFQSASLNNMPIPNLYEWKKQSDYVFFFYFFVLLAPGFGLLTISGVQTFYFTFHLSLLKAVWGCHDLFFKVKIRQLVFYKFPWSFMSTTLQSQNKNESSLKLHLGQRIFLPLPSLSVSPLNLKKFSEFVENFFFF